MQPTHQGVPNVDVTTGSMRSKWNRKRIGALAAAFVLTICLPVAIDQGYFRYSSYFLPLGGLAAVVAYVGLCLTSKPVGRWLRGLHERFQNRPLAYLVIVGTMMAVIFLVLVGGATFAISKSREHVAELRRREQQSPTPSPRVTATAPEITTKEPVEPPKPPKVILRKHQSSPEANPPAVALTANQPLVSANPPASSAPNNTPTVGSVTSIGQQGGITAGIININALPLNPGYGLLASHDVPYTGKPLAYLNTQRISSDDKPRGEFYVCVLLSLTARV